LRSAAKRPGPAVRSGCGAPAGGDAGVRREGRGWYGGGGQASNNPLRPGGRHGKAYVSSFPTVDPLEDLRVDEQAFPELPPLTSEPEQASGSLVGSIVTPSNPRPRHMPRRQLQEMLHDAKLAPSSSRTQRSEQPPSFGLGPAAIDFRCGSFPSIGPNCDRQRSVPVPQFAPVAELQPVAMQESDEKDEDGTEEEAKRRTIRFDRAGDMAKHMSAAFRRSTHSRT